MFEASGSESKNGRCEAYAKSPYAPPILRGVNSSTSFCFVKSETPACFRCGSFAENSNLCCICFLADFLLLGMPIKRVIVVAVLSSQCHAISLVVFILMPLSINECAIFHIGHLDRLFW